MSNHVKNITVRALAAHYANEVQYIIDLGTLSETATVAAKARVDDVRAEAINRVSRNFASICDLDEVCDYLVERLEEIRIERKAHAAMLRGRKWRQIGAFVKGSNHRKALATGAFV